ncbi:MAG: hypothetical protein ABI474_09240 [Actinomycetota bacterium]
MAIAKASVLVGVVVAVGTAVADVTAPADQAAVADGAVVDRDNALKSSVAIAMLNRREGCELMTLPGSKTIATSPLETPGIASDQK